MRTLQYRHETRAEAIGQVRVPGVARRGRRVRTWMLMWYSRAENSFQVGVGEASLRIQSVAHGEEVAEVRIERAQ